MTTNEPKTPFENLVAGMLSGRSRGRVEDLHPEDFKIIMDAIVALFFTSPGPHKKLGLEGMTDYEGIKIEFSRDIKYPSIKRDHESNYKIVVLPENNSSEESKLLMAKEALKEFDCLETIEKYELGVRILNSFGEKELSILAKEYDPFKRDTKKLEQRLKQRSQKRNNHSL